MITSATADRPYSTRLRTALVLTGTGTAGAYHAGVLRALHEAGVKVDIVAGRGIGVTGAMFAAVDGGARLWEENGIWKAPGSARYYKWRPAVRVAVGSLIAACLILAVPLALLALAVVVGVVGMVLTLVGLVGAGTAATTGYARWIETLFSPGALPMVIPRLVLFAVVAAIVALAVSLASTRLRTPKRRTRRGFWWRLFGAPLAPSALFERCTTELWSLIRGAAPLPAPPPVELARKYVELLGENLGQPGFRELLVAVHDMDARRDIVLAMLGDAHRHRFLAARPSSAYDVPRHAEALDLSGAARDHALDALAAALAIPLATEPHLMTFAQEGPWRGETHRLCDRPGALARVLEEVAAAGAEQVIVLSACAPPARAHELSAGRADLRGLAGEQLVAFETAALRDIVEQFAPRFAGLFVIRPFHNPLGPLDFAGAYDERSDRIHTVTELCDRGYEDAYRQFIEPVVGASGEQIVTQPVRR